MAGSDPRAKQAAATPKVTFTTATGEIVVETEVVATPAKISQGLMYREHLAPEAGMLFLMGREEDWAFYMRNTLIPLDMIFITHDLVVAGVVANATPRTEDHRKVGRPSTYVLEVNGGWAAAHQVAAGTKVRFDGVKNP
ncbi:MAG: DUF192 domain-containing protein [Kofleriaceae bacterium]